MEYGLADRYHFMIFFSFITFFIMLMTHLLYTHYYHIRALYLSLYDMHCYRLLFYSFYPGIGRCLLLYGLLGLVSICGCFRNHSWPWGFIYVWFVSRSGNHGLNNLIFVWRGFRMSWSRLLGLFSVSFYHYLR